MNLHTLLATPTEQWITGQVIVLDWHDGPRKRIGVLSHPRVEFLFEVVQERFNSIPKALTYGSTDFRRFLEPLGTPRNAIWAPIWRFEDETAEHRADDLLQRLQAIARPTPVLVESADLIHYGKVFSDTKQVSGNTHESLAPTIVSSRPL